jgi:hypothetical protein
VLSCCLIIWLQLLSHCQAAGHCAFARMGNHKRGRVKTRENAVKVRGEDLCNRGKKCSPSSAVVTANALVVGFFHVIRFTAALDDPQ